MNVTDAIGQPIKLHDLVLWAGGRAQTNTFDEGPLVVLKITSAGNVTVQRKDLRHQSVIAPNKLVVVTHNIAVLSDGRPMSTDQFLGKLQDAVIDPCDYGHYIQAWLEGAWDEALDLNS